jgi:hypothetical protein
VFFVLLVAGILTLEQFVLLWFYPEHAAQLAVRQLTPSDLAVQALRQYEFVKNVGTAITGAVIALLGLLCFGSDLRTLWRCVVRRRQ